MAGACSPLDRRGAMSLFGLSLDLSPEHVAIRDVARRFAENEVAPRVRDLERSGALPRDLIRRMGDLGLFGCCLPPDLGGSGAGALAHVLVVEEVARVWSSLRALFNTQAMTVACTIAQHATPDAAARLVPPLVRGEAIGAFALTEPGAGSDVAGIRTTARRVGGERGGFVLRGEKSWITHATVFDTALVAARTGAGGPHGLSLFVVPRGAPGLTAREIAPRLGHHGSPTGAITLDDVEVPAGNLVGDMDGGFSMAMRALERGRLSVAAGAVGVARAAIEAAAAYARDRCAFGRAIAEFQLVQGRFADMAARVEAARLLVHHAARKRDRGEPDAGASALAKLHAGETAVAVATAAFEVFGGNGYSEEFPAARLLRDAMLYPIGEGASDVLRLVVARQVLGVRAQR